MCKLITVRGDIREGDISVCTAYGLTGYGQLSVARTLGERQLFQRTSTEKEKESVHSTVHEKERQRSVFEINGMPLNID
ncbi:hypothetical protein TNCV_3625231 [Trichonephila clavipes]|nr:hypothetical protein TNCV_3625231 [Trichonephila clavipes]